MLVHESSSSSCLLLSFEMYNLILSGNCYSAGLGAPEPRKLQLSLARAEEAKQKALIKAKQKRKDASLPTVMINGKRQKRSALLRVAQVPYPFTSRKQYERSMRRPIGPEWNTCQSVRALTKKPELTRAGAIIAPISTKVKEG